MRAVRSRGCCQLSLTRSKGWVNYKDLTTNGREYAYSSGSKGTLGQNYRNNGSQFRSHPNIDFSVVCSYAKSENSTVIEQKSQKQNHLWIFQLHPCVARCPTLKYLGFRKSRASNRLIHCRTLAKGSAGSRPAWASMKHLWSFQFAAPPGSLKIVIQLCVLQIGDLAIPLCPTFFNLVPPMLER